ncbi:MAG: hypothetical protein IJ733_06185 [Lachnospiraceae bacterium]|nr:hypothetical protein [Lachnospiraceae bacterium]
MELGIRYRDRMMGVAVYAGKIYKDQVFFNNASGKWLRRLGKNRKDGS